MDKSREIRKSYINSEIIVVVLLRESPNKC